MFRNSVSDLKRLDQEISATKATWKEWPITSHRCKPVVPGKSYAEVMKTNHISS